MPKLYVYDTSRKITTNITVAFARGVIRYNNSINGKWQVKHMPIETYNINGLEPDLEPGVDAVATLGILRGTGKMLKQAKLKGIDYYYMDHAYFNPGYGGKGWMRISKNSHTCISLRDVTKDRWNGFHKNYGYQCNSWKKNSQRGQNILILPPTGAVSWFMDQGPDDWLDEVISKLKQYLPADEHYRIVVRRKPNEPVVDGDGNLLELKTYESSASDQPLNQALLDAQCVIAYNSMVALEATLQGIPVITSENSCCVRVSYDLDLYKDQVVPEEFNIEPVNRKPLLYWLANNQYKRREIEDGSAWKMIQENN
tara:strand:+ start:1151 stop:2086 length:936 start_codon:yes stop_codon:yes gene_type:complete